MRNADFDNLPSPGRLLPDPPDPGPARCDCRPGHFRAGWTGAAGPPEQQGVRILGEAWSKSMKLASKRMHSDFLGAGPFQEVWNSPTQAGWQTQLDAEGNQPCSPSGGRAGGRPGGFKGRGYPFAFVEPFAAVSPARRSHNSHCAAGQPGTQGETMQIGKEIPGARVEAAGRE